jgi:hypothetical protein
MHSPNPRKLVVAGHHAVYFGIGWHTASLPQKANTRCARSRAVVVSLEPSGGTRLPVESTRVCPLRSTAGRPYVAVSAILRAGQFTDANP